MKTRVNLFKENLASYKIMESKQYIKVRFWVFFITSFTSLLMAFFYAVIASVVGVVVSLLFRLCSCSSVIIRLLL